MNFITGEKFQELADITVALNVENNFASGLVQTQLKNTKTVCLVFDPNVSINMVPDKIKDAKIIFVYSHILPFFFEKIYPFITNPFILITHNSDHGVDEKIIPYLNETKIIKWFCQNKYANHPKLLSLPIGIANSQWEHGNLQLLEETIKLKIPKNNLVYKNFNISTNYNHRQQAHIETLQNGFQMSPSVPFSEHIKNIKQSYFCFAPLGNGADCHRIWECLYLNCVPIVPKHLFAFDDFQHLPILFVDDYKQITTEFLEKQIENFYPFSKFNLETLDLNYWRNEIHG
jgi:hypothetical protein